MRSFLLVSALVALAACDSTGDIEPLGGRLVVSLQGSSTLLLESETDIPCVPRIVAERVLRGGRLTVSVLGTEATEGACPAVLGPASTTVSIETGGANPLPIDIIFGGLVDEYAYSTGSRGARLDSVRTTVTRLGPR